ncbi:hypothetical protein [Amycolatopsis benzoatilytica]|uniref:hypothetical protein n=1 Tax=Amycolatopsis benzoatilytica TaxID=346045 RepID=UPI0003648DE7|nr:hypothetical protein [Amycolatopsis benzoatilytica]
MAEEEDLLEDERIDVECVEPLSPEDEADLAVMAERFHPGELIPQDVWEAADRYVKRNYPRTGFTPPGMVRGRR